MCGGAIISDPIPLRTASRRLTADHLWAGLKNGSRGSGKKKGRKYEELEFDDDFQADFEDFKDESEEDEEEEEIDVKPLAFASKAPFCRGKLRNSVEMIVLLAISLFFVAYDLML